MIQPLKVLPEGLVYLNIGCGGKFFKEWNNLELYGGEDVVIHDIRRPLPYPDNSFDAVYHSHVLEHLNPEEAKSLLQEVRRVLKANGICRIVVPDLRENLPRILALAHRVLGGTFRAKPTTIYVADTRIV